MKSRFRWAGLLLVAALLAAGCQGSVSVGGDQLDTAEAETEIAKGIEGQTGIAVEVECPDDIDLREGNDFECTATADDGTERSVNVTQDDDEGNISWELGD